MHHDNGLWLGRAMAGVSAAATQEACTKKSAAVRNEDMDFSRSSSRDESDRGCTAVHRTRRLEAASDFTQRLG